MSYTAPDFNTYLMRFGESGVQAIIENIEHYEGIASVPTMPLEKRWQSVMEQESLKRDQMAA